MYPPDRMPVPQAPRILYRLDNGVMATAEVYAAILKRKRAAIRRMCNAAREYLTIDIDAALEALDNVPDAPPLPNSPPLADFAQAALGNKEAMLRELADMTTDCEAIEHRIAELNHAMEAVDPEDMNGSMLAAALGAMMPMLDENLRERQRRKERLQTMLDAYGTMVPSGGAA